MGVSRAKRIVVSGVSRGLGLAMTEGFIGQGHTVFGCARSEKSLAPLRNRWPAPHRFEPVDVTDDEQVRRWAAASLSVLGGVDLLINNAALINRNAPLWKISAGEFSQVVDTNIKGVANVIRHFAPSMVAAAAGVIVNFSSGWGRHTAVDVAPYCATKWAIEGLSQALAQELPAGMAAVALDPGTINTDMLRSCYGEQASEYPDPEDWARRAVGFILKIGPQDNGRPLTVPAR